MVRGYWLPVIQILIVYELGTSRKCYKNIYSVSVNFNILPHYENLPMQCIDIFQVVKFENFQYKICDIFLIFAQNIDCGYTLEPPRRGGSNEYPQTSTHNLCFGAKIRKIGLPLHTPV